MIEDDIARFGSEIEKKIVQVRYPNGELRTGFFCEIPIPKNEIKIKVLLTTYSNLKEEEIEEGVDIEVFSITDIDNGKKIHKKNCEIIFQDEFCNATMIKIFNNNNENNDNIINNINYLEYPEKYDYYSKSIFLVDFSSDKKLIYPIGLITKKEERKIEEDNENEHKIEFFCFYKGKSFGGPILIKEKEENEDEKIKVIGIHFGNYNKEGKYWNSGINILKIINCYYGKKGFLFISKKMKEKKNNNNQIFNYNQNNNLNICELPNSNQMNPNTMYSCQNSNNPLQLQMSYNSYSQTYYSPNNQILLNPKTDPIKNNNNMNHPQNNNNQGQNNMNYFQNNNNNQGQNNMNQGQNNMNYPQNNNNQGQNNMILDQNYMNQGQNNMNYPQNNMNQMCQIQNNMNQDQNNTNYLPNNMPPIQNNMNQDQNNMAPIQNNMNQDQNNTNYPPNNMAQIQNNMNQDQNNTNYPLNNMPPIQNNMNQEQNINNPNNYNNSMNQNQNIPDSQFNNMNINKINQMPQNQYTSPIINSMSNKNNINNMPNNYNNMNVNNIDTNNNFNSINNNININAGSNIVKINIPQQNNMASVQISMCPQQNNMAPVQNNMVPQYNNMAPQQNNMAPQQNNLAPQQNNMDPNVNLVNNQNYNSFNISNTGVNQKNIINENINNTQNENKNIQVENQINTNNTNENHIKNNENKDQNSLANNQNQINNNKSIISQSGNDNKNISNQLNPSYNSFNINNNVIEESIQKEITNNNEIKIEKIKGETGNNNNNLINGSNFNKDNNNQSNDMNNNKSNEAINFSNNYNGNNFNDNNNNKNTSNNNNKVNEHKTHNNIKEFKDIYPYIEGEKINIIFSIPNKGKKGFKIPSNFTRKELYYTAYNLCEYQEGKFEYKNLLKLYYNGNLLSNDDEIENLKNDDEIEIKQESIISCLDHNGFIELAKGSTSQIKKTFSFIDILNQRIRVDIPGDITITEIVDYINSIYNNLFDSNRVECEIHFNGKKLDIKNKPIGDVNRFKKYNDIPIYIKIKNKVCLKKKPGSIFKVKIFDIKNKDQSIHEISFGTLEKIKDFYVDLKDELNKKKIKSFNPSFEVDGNKLDLNKDDEKTFLSIDVKNDFKCVLSKLVKRLSFFGR